jgi:hypothetical protein
MDTILSLLAGIVLFGLSAYFVSFLAYLRKRGQSDDLLQRLDEYC